jgi:hypothetical protein
MPCPLLGFRRVRVYHVFPTATPQTAVCSAQPLHKPLLICNAFVCQLLRYVCALFRGVKVFGFGPPDIGNKSLRSGAAMSLFLMDHSVARIMILGRWSSDAFLVYIRPQVLEWTNNMSKDMISNDSFFDATHKMPLPPTILLFASACSNPSMAVTPS